MALVLLWYTIGVLAITGGTGVIACYLLTCLRRRK